MNRFLISSSRELIRQKKKSLSAIKVSKWKTGLTYIGGDDDHFGGDNDQPIIGNDRSIYVNLTEDSELNVSISDARNAVARKAVFEY